MFKKIGKFVVLPLLLVTLAIGGTAGIVLADDEETETTGATCYELIAEDLGLTIEELQGVYDEARAAVLDEATAGNRGESFRDMVAEILEEEYGITAEEWQAAIDEAREGMQETCSGGEGVQQGQMSSFRTAVRTRIADCQQALEEQVENCQAGMKGFGARNGGFQSQSDNGNTSGQAFRQFSRSGNCMADSE